MSDMSDKWTLVTGANGFVGSNLVRQLVNQGTQVKALVRPGADLRALADIPTDRMRLAVGNLCIPSSVFAAMRGCDRAFHVASSVSVNEKKRESIVSTAEEGTRSVLEAARRAGLSRVVVTSSLLTLDATAEPRELEESTSAPTQSQNAYAQAKRLAEREALEKFQAAVDVVVVNPGFIVGPGDWKPTATGRLLLQYLRTSPTLQIPVIPGGFNWVGVQDVVQGQLAAMEKGRAGERYFLGGENLTHRELVTLLSDLTGLAEPGSEISPAKLKLWAQWSELSAWWSRGEPVITKKLVNDYYGKFVFLSSNKAKEQLGYTPQLVRPALGQALRWYLERAYLPERLARRARLEVLPSVS